MKEKKKKQDRSSANRSQPLTPEEELIAKEKQRIKKNKIKNRPIVVITYLMVTVFVGMIAYVIYFMQFKAETVIANSRNVRQDSFAKTVERGDIITSDGVVTEKQDWSLPEISICYGRTSTSLNVFTAN
jgi:peptidoglycan glycosyltransferase